MTILAIGETGNIGARVVDKFLAQGAEVRVLVRDRAKAKLPAFAEATAEAWQTG